MALSSYKDFLQRVRDEQAFIVKIKEKIAEREKALDRAVIVLEDKALQEDLDLDMLGMGEVTPKTKAQSNPVSSVSIISDYPEYPFNKDRKDRIKYIVEKNARALRMPDIQEVITKLEGPTKSKATLRSFNYVLNQMVEAGMLLSGKIAGSKKHTFYIIAEFLDASGKLKTENYPMSEAMGKLPQTKWNIPKTKWIGKLNK